MDSPSRVYFGHSNPSRFQCEHTSSQPIAAELTPRALGVCDVYHQVFAQERPPYEIEAMSPIHGQIARLAWPSLMAACRGKVLALDARDLF